jgi:hypothetical protein
MATSVEKPMITDVERAFALGWQLAELFHSPVHQSPVEYGEAGNRLPGISELAPPNRSVLLARQIESGILVLHLPDQPNDPPPSSKEVENLLRADPPRSRTEVRQAILELHINILEILTVADFRLGKAYGLGRALAETVIVPAEAETDKRGQAFNDLFEFGRLLELKQWLSELKTNFGPHAAYAVHGSLDRWSEWVNATPNGDLATMKNLSKSLWNQGKVWRGLLSGEKQSTDLLSAIGYLDGAVALLKRIGKLTQNFLLSVWGLAILAVMGILIGTVYGISNIHSLNTGNKLAADFAVVVSALGITMKGVMSSLGKIVAKAEGPLWESELDESCAVKATQLPDHVPVHRHYRKTDKVTPVHQVSHLDKR